ncbi:MAG TPA: hypothetical protein VHI78_11450 [Bacteroidales bacterium]|jgi:hypothetical protein|nr:hypothetical protein [Bacteroidales bacterium]
MARYDNIFDKIQELLGCIPGSVSILEQQIDSDVQTEYYNYAQNLQKKFNPEDVLRNRNIVFEEDLTPEDRKDMMVKLATIDNIEAYRTLEKCTGTMTDQLKDWAILALQENRLLLESKLLDQNRILISTGLGGKGLKLRYFTALMSLNKIYSEFEQKVIVNEVHYAFKKIEGELESIHFDKELCTILGMIPLQVAVQKFYDDIISECNLYGDFMNRQYIITNVKVIPNPEIRKMTSSRRKQNPEE